MPRFEEVLLFLADVICYIHVQFTCRCEIDVNTTWVHSCTHVRNYFFADLAKSSKSAHHCFPKTLGEHSCLVPLAMVYPSMLQSPILNPPRVTGKCASLDGMSNCPHSPVTG